MQSFHSNPVQKRSMEDDDTEKKLSYNEYLSFHQAMSGEKNNLKSNIKIENPAKMKSQFQHKRSEDESNSDIQEIFNELKQALNKLGIGQVKQYTQISDKLNYFCIPVYEKEPLTALAYCLNSKQYNSLIETHQLDQYEEQLQSNPKIRLTDNFKTFIASKLSLDGGDLTAANELKVSFEILDTEIENHKRNYYESLQTTFVNNKELPKLITSYNECIPVFQKAQLYTIDNKNNNNCVIKVYYPIQFEALRLGNGISLSKFLKSLAINTKAFSNKGGKSAASFLKTSDEIFVFKDLKKKEFKMFNSFAYNYFKHMIDELNNKPSVLAKIYGMFEMKIRGQKYYYIAMENLFYGISNQPQVFDLKGSEANRLSKNNEIFLDTDFKIKQNGMPFPISLRSKEYLDLAIEFDKNLLVKHNLVDYSLLVIIDHTQKKVRFGIIDYLRIYTQDKKVENILKTQYNKFMKGGVLPTIVDSEEYFRRFAKSMKEYFAGIPEN